MIPHQISVDSAVCTIGEMLSLQVCGLFVIGDKVIIFLFPTVMFIYICLVFVVCPFLFLFPFLFPHCSFFQTILCTLGFSITSILPIWGALF